MRPRAKKNLNTRIARCAGLLEEDPAARKGCWRGEKKEVRLEIGCGKGAFLCEMARRHPDVLFVGLECVRNVIVLALEKAAEAGLSNVVFVCGNARCLDDYFAEGEVDRIYLNFSDPWPKARQAKYRLTSDSYLPLYIKLLKERGSIVQKTDNRPLFDFSLKMYEMFGCRLSGTTFDLHGAGAEPENGGEGALREECYADSLEVITEYEGRFMTIGVPICRTEAVMPPKADVADRIRRCEEALREQNEAARIGRKRFESRAAQMAQENPSAGSARDTEDGLK